MEYDEGAFGYGKAGGETLTKEEGNGGRVGILAKQFRGFAIMYRQGHV
jgi:hypothetical protein